MAVHVRDPVLAMSLAIFFGILSALLISFISGYFIFRKKMQKLRRGSRPSSRSSGTAQKQLVRISDTTKWSQLENFVDDFYTKEKNKNSQIVIMLSQGKFADINVFVSSAKIKNKAVTTEIEKALAKDEQAALEAVTSDILAQATTAMQNSTSSTTTTTTTTTTSSTSLPDPPQFQPRPVSPVVNSPHAVTTLSSNPAAPGIAQDQLLSTSLAPRPPLPRISSSPDALVSKSSLPHLDLLKTSQTSVIDSTNTTTTIIQHPVPAALSTQPIPFDNANPKAWLKQYLLAKKVMVENALKDSISSNIPETQHICNSMLYSLLAGGKRIRPVLVLTAAEMFGAAPDIVMPTAVAIEMIHTMSLIHDDLPAMDNDSVRRGRPTNHVVYGEDIAILAGDALLCRAFEIVATQTKGVQTDKILQVIAVLADAVGIEGLAGGQVMDLASENTEISLDSLTWIHKHKTAVLLRASVAAGAILAGASSQDVQCVSEFAEKIGLAFQIADDVLDVTSTSEELGKTAGKDEATNKATFPRLMGLEQSKLEAANLVKQAKDLLKPYGERAIPLLAIADYIIHRSN